MKKQRLGRGGAHVGRLFLRRICGHLVQRSLAKEQAQGQVDGHQQAHGVGELSGGARFEHPGHDDDQRARLELALEE